MEQAFQEQGDRWVAIAAAAPKGAELLAMIEDYLSMKHLHAPGTGCPLAALGAEMGRQPLAVRKRIHKSMLSYRERMLPFIPGATVEERRKRFFILFSGMAGAIMAARAIEDARGRENALAAAREFYLALFIGNGRV